MGRASINRARVSLVGLLTPPIVGFLVGLCIATVSRVKVIRVSTLRVSFTGSRIKVIYVQ